METEKLFPEFEVEVQPHPTLDAAFWGVEHSRGNSDAVPEFLKWLSISEEIQQLTPFESLRDEALRDNVKSKVRDLLRHGGYKPTGRGKPASEYLIKAVGNGKLGHINPVVDLINVVSLHSGLPISVVDIGKCDLQSKKLRVEIAPAETEYVFNASGQTIKLDGLLCLFDAMGPCGNAVKDSQRTKTSNTTEHSLVVIWGTQELPGQTQTAATWFRELAESTGLICTDIKHTVS